MTTLDVPQTTSLLKYIEKKDFKTAYKLACLGITEQDFKLLGTEALQGGDIEIARKV
jgi:intraflagellar transport protein 122